MVTFYDVISIIAIFVRAIGLLLFGVTAGWLLLKMLGQEEINWQLQGILFVVFFGFLAYLSHSLSAGALGALTLGISGGLLFWGVISGEKEKPEK